MRKLIVANYKMNGSKSFYLSALKQIKKISVKDTDLVLCPPFVYLPFFENCKNFSLGAQNLANVVNNKNTGEISVNMLKDNNVKYCIVGHSERRAMGETNEQINQKVKLCVDNEITPIICVGENKMNSSLNKLKSQVKSAVLNVSSKNIIFAYEPIWAIGTGVTPTIDRIKKAVQIIKSSLKEVNISCKVLYGGSVNNENYKQFLDKLVDGFLLGGISLKIKEFIELVEGVENE